MSESDSISEILMSDDEIMRKMRKKRFRKIYTSKVMAILNDAEFDFSEFDAELLKAMDDKLSKEFRILLKKMCNDNNVIEKFKKMIDELIVEIRKNPEMNKMDDDTLLNIINNIIVMRWMPEEFDEMESIPVNPNRHLIFHMVADMGLWNKLSDRVHQIQSNSE